jgi:hypothetical protein
MTTTPAQVPPELQAMIAPGQKSILEEFLAGQEGDTGAEDSGPLGQFLREQEAPAEPPADDDLPAKYRGKSAAEVYRLVQQENEYRAQQQAKEPAAAPEVPAFTREKSIGDYGEALTDAFEKAEVNPYEIAAKVQAGAEVDATTIGKLVEATGYPQSVVEGYINSFRPAPAVPAGQPLDDAAKAQLVAAAGGTERVAAVNAWVTENVDAAEIEAFNALVDSGNQTAALALLKGFDARYQAATPREPNLLAGGAPSAGDGGLVFADDDEAVAAMAKKDAQGRRLYNVDPVYRKKVDAAMARSKVFL